MDTIGYSLLSGAIGALIGTFLGAYLSFLRQEKSKRMSRKKAIEAIKMFSSYAKKDGTFNLANQEFNKSFNLAEKRAVLVALHKLGIPVVVSPEAGFILENVCFDKVKIDKEELKVIREQIEKGFCDQLFYIDPDTYFKENIRITTIRSLANRWITEVFSASSFDFSTNTVLYPNDWSSKYSWGEKLALAVFKMRVINGEYFNADGKPNLQRIGQLTKEVDTGLWDNCLFWDIEAYQNMLSTNTLNTQIANILQANMVSGAKEQR